MMPPSGPRHVARSATTSESRPGPPRGERSDAQRGIRAGTGGIGQGGSAFSSRAAVPSIPGGAGTHRWRGLADRVDRVDRAERVDRDERPDRAERPDRRGCMARRSSTGPTRERERDRPVTRAWWVGHANVVDRSRERGGSVTRTWSTGLACGRRRPARPAMIVDPFAPQRPRPRRSCNVANRAECLSQSRRTHDHPPPRPSTILARSSPVPVNLCCPSTSVARPRQRLLPVHVRFPSTSVARSSSFPVHVCFPSTCIARL